MTSVILKRMKLKFEYTILVKDFSIPNLDNVVPFHCFDGPYSAFYTNSYQIAIS